MSIRAVVFDIGGVLELSPDGAEPTTGLQRMIEKWDAQLGHQPGALDAQLRALDERLKGTGKDGALGTCTEAEWLAELRQVTGFDQQRTDAFMNDFWDVYLGAPNTELIAFLASLRPRYKTALLSNSFVGAREREEERYHFAAITDLIIYSHEVGLAKPDPRIYLLTCERLGIQPAEMLFLDDAEPAITGARDLGIHAIHFHDTAQALAELQTTLAAHPL